MHKTTARSGGFRYRPQMSYSLSTNNGSLESFQCSWRCGCSPNARQIRLIAFWLIPISAAIDRVDQCVAFFGVLSSVLITTASTCSSAIVRGRPGRGSSTNPSIRNRANRPRHLVTVGRDTRWRSAISPFVNPPAASSTIRARNANACALVCRRVKDSNNTRSSSVNSIETAVGVGMPEAFPHCKPFKHSGH